MATNKLVHPVQTDGRSCTSRVEAFFEIGGEPNTHDLLSTSGSNDTRSGSDDVQGREIVHVHKEEEFAQKGQLRSV